MSDVMIARWLRKVRRFPRRCWFALETYLNRLARWWLLRHDWNYQLRDAQNRLVAERIRLREQGIGAADPRYPSLGDFLDSKFRASRS